MEYKLEPIKVSWKERIVDFMIYASLGFLVFIALYCMYMLYKFGVRVL